MIKEIVLDKEFLSKPSKPLTLIAVLDMFTGGGEGLNRIKEVVRDLTDTAFANGKSCIGLAANQIGSVQPIFVMKVGKFYVPIVAPQVVAVSKEMKSDSETCLSFPREKRFKVRRHKWITIKYFDMFSEVIVTRKFKKFEARVVQHELDHLKGKTI